jgi:hypothetical protein
VIQKHVCVVDRVSMLKGLPATEQCVVIDGVNFSTPLTSMVLMRRHRARQTSSWQPAAHN